MGGSACQQVDNTASLQACKALNQFSIAIPPGLAMDLDCFGQVVCRLFEGGSRLGKQLQASLDPAWKTLLQVNVTKER